MKQKQRSKGRPRTKTPSKTKKQKVKKLSSAVTIPLFLITVFVVFATIYKISNSFSSHISKEIITIPKLEISLADVPIEQIDIGQKDTKYENNIVSLTTTDEHKVFNNVSIKGRGNATWNLPKKPYQISFSNKENLFNFGGNKKWILLANYSDRTLLRTDIAFYIEHLLGEKYPLEGTFIELYIDNNYRGLYYLSEKLEIGKSRVELTEPDSIIMELDNLYGANEFCYQDNDNDCLVAKDTVNKDKEKQNAQSFLKDFNSLKSAIKEKDYSDINELIDVDSFARYYLLNEFAINPDAYSTSFFMRKETSDGKIFAGPGWDFDAAFGNQFWDTSGIDSDAFHSPESDRPLEQYLDTPEKVPYANTISHILYDLMNIPEFETRVKEIYQETLSGKKDELLNYIKSQADYIKDAALRDQERWKLKTNFEEEINNLIDWVSKRCDHFEETYGAKPGTKTIPNAEEINPEL